MTLFDSAAYAVTEAINLNGCEITAAVTVIANSLAGKLSDDQLALAAAVFTQLGDTLATIAVSRSICEKTDKTCRADG